MRAIPTMFQGLTLHKGHAAEADYLVYTDETGAREPSEAQVAQLCDRYAGIGAQGLIRVVASEKTSDGAQQVSREPRARWYVDAKTPEGLPLPSLVNALQIAAAHLSREGRLVPGAREVHLATPLGPQHVTINGHMYTAPAGVGPGQVQGGDGGQSPAEGEQTGTVNTAVRIVGLEGDRAGIAALSGSNHVVVALPGTEELHAANLAAAVAYSPAQSAATNLVLVAPTGDTEVAGRTIGTAEIRVLDGVRGELRSCGAAACAAAWALALWADGTSIWQIDTPGGQVAVQLTDGGALLTGPVTLLAEIKIF